MGKDVIIACDFASSGASLRFFTAFPVNPEALRQSRHGAVLWRRVRAIVRESKRRGHRVFSRSEAARYSQHGGEMPHGCWHLDVDITNLHAAGTRAMMEAALEGLTRPDGTRPLLIAVTQLTSTDQAAMERDLLIESPWRRW